MAVNQPAGIVPGSAGVNYTFISDLSILKPQAYDKFIDKYGAQNYTQILEMLGFERTVPARNFFHFQAYGKLHSYVTVASFTYTTDTAYGNGDTSIGAGEGVVITIAAASHYPNTSGTQSPLRVGEVLENTKNGYQYKIVAVDKTSAGAHKATIVPLDGSLDSDAGSPTNIANGDVFMFRGITEAGEASSKSQTLANRIEKKEFTTTEIREDYEISDIASMQEIYFSVDGQNFYTRKGLNEAVRRFMNNKEFKLLFGSPVQNSSKIGVNSAGTTGLFPTIDAGGQSSTWDGTTWAISNFHDLVRKADFNGGAQEYHFLMDSYLRTAVDDALFTKYQNGAIVWASVGGNSEVAVKYGFDSIKIDGTTFHLKKYLPFNPETVYGVTPANGSKYKNRGYCIPMDSGRDAVNGEKIPSLSVVYNELSPGQKVKVWETGAMAKIPTNDTVSLNVHHMSYCGMQVFAENRFLAVSTS